MPRDGFTAQPSDAVEQIRAEAIDTGLHPKTIGLAGALDGPSWRILHLARGAADILAGPDAFRLEGPALLLQPWTSGHRLRILAGATGGHILIGPTALSNAIGRRPESADLRHLAERRAVISLSGRPEVINGVSLATTGILREVAEAERGWQSVVEALVRVLLIHFWRERGGAALDDRLGQSGRSLFGRFSSLVETHYQKRWTVAQYALALGISADRLNDVCRRARQRTPREIIVARTMVEARRLLVSSPHSIDQIAGLLGFSSAAHFNRFFRSEEGLAPGRYRRQQAEASPPRRQITGGELFDWP